MSTINQALHVSFSGSFVQDGSTIRQKSNSNGKPFRLGIFNVIDPNTGQVTSDTTTAVMYEGIWNLASGSTHYMRGNGVGFNLELAAPVSKTADELVAAYSTASVIAAADEAAKARAARIEARKAAVTEQSQVAQEV